MTRAETEASVRACYATWSESYYDDYYGDAAPYPPVQRELIRRLLVEAAARRVLDAGCGPASFLRHLADTAMELYGFDLTPQMVEEARAVLAGLGREPGRVWEGSVLDPAAFGPPSGPPDGFDAVVCVGVLPHVRAEDEPTVLGNMHDALAPGGLAVLEARNQLFALFTMNRYSKQFMDEQLIRLEALRARAGPDEPELAAVSAEMTRHFRMDLPPLRTGAGTEPGYDEVLSRTHNPLLLPKVVAGAGFEDVRVLFYHYHCLPPMFESSCSQLFRRESLALENPDDWRGHFMASAFLVTGRRP
jgi:SAM-dependent methyltransferase